MTKTYVNDIAYQVIGAAIEVQKYMGRGLLESVYHLCMKDELTLRNLNFKSEFVLPVTSKERRLNGDFRCDILVEDCVVVELKAVNEMIPAFEAQLLTYMKLLQVPPGLLINFNSDNIFNKGQKAFVNDYFRELPE